MKSRTIMAVLALVAVAASTWMGHTASGQQEKQQKKGRTEARPNGELIRLPEADAMPIPAGVSFKVPQGSFIEIDVHYNMPDERTVRAKVDPADTLTINQFRKVTTYVIIDGQAKPPLTGRGHAALLVRALEKGKGTITINAGRAVFEYKIEVE